jgi:DNA (cytosine-5)-methyltransferase 1
LEELRDQERIRIDRVPLIKALRDESGFYAEDDFSPSSSRSVSPRKKPLQPLKSSNPEVEVLKHRNPTVVTPLVSNIAAMLFERTLRVAGQLEHDDIEDDAASDIDDFMHHDDPESIDWLEPAEAAGYYKSVDMDGVTYSVCFGFSACVNTRSHPAKVGDAVMVMPGSDVDRRRSANAIAKISRSKNTLGNTAWFVYLFIL